MKYGYARVSTEDQNADMQLTALKRAGCKTAFTDQLSGATGVKRPALLRCLKKLEHGDTLMVWKLDRLGRSLRDPITLLDDLKKRGVSIAHRSHRHRDAHRPRHVANDRCSRGTRKKHDYREDTRRDGARESARHQARTEAEPSQ